MQNDNDKRSKRIWTFKFLGMQLLNIFTFGLAGPCFVQIMLKKLGGKPKMPFFMPTILNVVTLGFFQYGWLLYLDSKVAEVCRANDPDFTDSSMHYKFFIILACISGVFLMLFAGIPAFEAIIVTNVIVAWREPYAILQDIARECFGIYLLNY